MSQESKTPLTDKFWDDNCRFTTFESLAAMRDFARTLELEVASLTAKLAEARKDGERIDHLEKLIKACPHARFYWTDDTDEEMPVGFSITIEGCEVSQVSGKTLRNCIDAEITIDAAMQPLPPAPTERA